MEQCAREITDQVEILMMEELSMHIGVYFDQNPQVFDPYQVIIGAADYSLITTRAVKRAIKRHSRFLSLPLSTNDKRSMLTYHFLNMDTKSSKTMAQIMMKYFNAASRVEVTTEKGTRLKFGIRGRRAGFFNGCCRDGKGFSSASMEVYVPVIEDQTEGVLVLDGSMGYIGAVSEPITIAIRGGRITAIEQNESGKRLIEYMESYEDPAMFFASELGIGLNTFSRCEGKCYIEDESAYGTFHIGFGRNLALGGVLEASGHFDLVSREPDIFVDNRMIMEKGRIMTLEAQMNI